MGTTTGMGMKFTERDKENALKFLNKVAERAKFDGLQVKEIIDIFGLLAWAQKELIAKIEANILEIVAVHEAPESGPADGSGESD